MEDILLQVKKPARYIGEEWNVSRKDFDRAQVKFALCFPELYEVAMSNIGLRILYGVLNNAEDIVCERVFSYDSDAQELIRRGKMRVSSLESKRPLSDFDIIGFSLPYELCYTNILDMLELSGIPLRSALRDESFPLVIGGGSCAANPEPMHDFFDLFVIGEAEEAVLEIVEIYRRNKSGLKSKTTGKQNLLLELSRIEGVYVPSLYRVRYSDEGIIERFDPPEPDLPLKVKKRYVKDLDNAYFPKRWIVPYIQIIHDRIALEIMRGCPNQCRFCQARNQYFPFRFKSPERIIEDAREAYASSGYEEISLCGLSVSDYPRLEELSVKLHEIFRGSAVSFSLPSVKPKRELKKVPSLIASVRKTGLTFAPEAASPRLRNVLGKDFDQVYFYEILKESFSAGYQHVKLYFMTGLPLEAQEDLDAIIDFANEVSYSRKKIDKPPATVSVSINTLIPKPHTPLQWAGMSGLDEIESAQAYLKSKAKNKRLKVSFHNARMSIIEAILARGDRRLSKVILKAHEKGACFDSWEEHFNFNAWIEAFSECGLDYRFYLRERRTDEILPWDLIDFGVSKGHLVAEYNKSIATQ